MVISSATLVMLAVKALSGIKNYLCWFMIYVVEMRKSVVFFKLSLVELCTIEGAMQFLSFLASRCTKIDGFMKAYCHRINMIFFFDRIMAQDYVGRVVSGIDKVEETSCY
ncbi:hypothetical protein EDC96DRAFT_540013 [Choanephora cucurbitarum]|nr:hypothetical protein EDC96DRAFT_540013 [Choanephora cucurbitarum]